MWSQLYLKDRQKRLQIYSLKDDINLLSYHLSMMERRIDTGPKANDYLREIRRMIREKEIELLDLEFRKIAPKGIKESDWP